MLDRGCHNALVAVTSDQDASFAAPPPRGPVTRGPRPTFSVHIAAWQAAATIGESVESVLAQTELPLEIVVCDDGSTDDLVGALEPFGDTVRLLRIDHGGESIARNTAVAGTSGDFVVNCDADDVWEPQRLQRLGDLAQSRPDLDLLTTDAWFVVDGKRRGTFHQANEFATVDQATEILRRNFFVSHVAVRRTRWLELGGYRPGLNRGQDWDMWLRLLLSGSAAGCVLEPLAEYRIHGESLSADRYRSLMARVELLDLAEAEHDLTHDQQAALETARADYRHRALVARAETLLMQRGTGRRQASLDVLRSPGAGFRMRLLSAAAVLAPGVAGARLRSAATVRGRAASDRSVPGEQPA